MFYHKNAAESKTILKACAVRAVSLLLISCSVAYAKDPQVLRTFSVVEGQIEPNVTVVGDMIYGVVNGGAPGLGFDGGFVFKVKNDGSDFQILKNFVVTGGKNGGWSEGMSPNSPLVVVDGFVYGTTMLGGAAAQGTVFKVSTNGVGFGGSGFSIIKHFDGNPQGHPNSGLTLQGKSLFGALAVATALDEGGIFRIDTNGLNYGVYASRAVGASPLYPNAPPVVVGNKIYDTAALSLIGEDYGPGILWSVTTNDTSFTIMKSFPDNVLGSTPTEVTEDGGWLYGVSDSVSAFSRGSVYRVKTDGTGFQTLYAFSETNNAGYKPVSGLTVMEGMIYGATELGGANNGGALYRMAVDGTGFSVIGSFSAGSGNPRNPYGLAVTADALIGAANSDSTGVSTLFKLDLVQPFEPVFVATPADRKAANIIAMHVSNRAIDPNLQTQPLTYTLLDPPAGMSIDTNGLISWTPSFSQDGDFIIRTVASRGALSATNQFTVTVTSSFNPPQVIPTPSALHTFSVIEGQVAPNVTVVGDMIYGVVDGGTAGLGFDGGFIFKMKNDGTGFEMLKNFVKTGTGGAGSFSQGMSPNSPLVVVDGMIYGTTMLGGTSAQGTVFKLSTNGTGFSVIKSFDGNPQGHPNSGLTFQGKSLFGSLSVATALDDGGIFRIDTNGLNYGVYASRAVGASPLYPNAPPVVVGNKIYDTAALSLIGEDYGPGILWSVTTNDTSFTIMKSFPDNVLGSTPTEVTEDGGWLYGVSDSVSAFSRGSVYRVKTDGTGFQTLYAFSETNNAGYKPVSGLTVMEGMIYGATELGGANNGGALYRMAVDGTGFSVIGSFSAGSGNPRNPYGLAVTADALIGAANSDSTGVSTLFKLAVPAVAQPNRAPVFDRTPDAITVAELAGMAVTNRATDADGQALTYSLLNPPAGAAISSSGVITWTPTELQGPSTNSVVTVVTDGFVRTTNQFNVVVSEVNTSPVLTLPASLSINELSAYKGSAMSSDADLPANVLSVALVSGPAGLSVASNGAIAWTPTESQGPGSYAVVLRVSDNGSPALSSTNSFTITVLEWNTAPVLSKPADGSVAELGYYTVQLMATDVDQPTNALSYALVSGPAGLTVMPDGVVSWTPSEAQGGSVNTITVRVTDNGVPSLSATQSFVLTVNEVNSLPLLHVPADGVIAALNPYTGTATASDSDVPANNLSFALVSGPAGLTVSTTGSISWTPTLAQAGSVNPVTLRVTDDGAPALSSTNTFTLTVNTVDGNIVLLDNLAGQFNADFTFAEGETNVWAAQSFWSGSAEQLTRVELNLRRMTAADGAFRVQLYDAAMDGVPGAAVATLGQNQLIASLGTGEEASWVSTNVNVSLATNREYFVVVQQETTTSTGLLWGYASEAITNSAFNQTLDGGLSWADPDYTYPQRMRIEGNAAVVLPPVVVSSNRTPVFGSVADVTLAENSVLVVTNSANDPDNQVLTYSLVNAPAGAVIDTNGIIVWTAATLSTHSFTTVVSDGLASATNSFTVIVTATPVVVVNTAPVLSKPADGSVAELGYYTVQLMATDVDQPTNALSYALVSGPAGLTVMPDGVVSWTPSEAQGGSVNTITVRVTDNGVPSLSATQSFVLTVNEVNSLPLLHVPADGVIAALNPYTGTATASDSDVPANNLSFALVSGPAGLTVSTTGSISWTPTLAQAGSVNPVTLRVTDDGAPALSSTNTFTLTVNTVDGNIVLLDNLAGQFNADFTFAEGETNVWAAQSFWSGSAEQLTRVELNLRRMTAADGAFRVQLYDAAMDGVPGAAVATLGQNQLIASLGTGEEASWVSTNVNVSLATNREYFVVVQQETTTSTGLLWGYASEAITNSAFNQTLDGGLSWADPDYTYPQRMRIEGNAAVVLPPVVVSSNRTPVFGSVADVTLAENSVLVVTNSANDPDNQVLTYSLVNAPAGAVIDTNGIIVWTAATLSTHSFTTVVSDGLASATNSFTVIVTATIGSPNLLVATLKASRSGDFTFTDSINSVWAAQSFNSGSANRLTNVTLNLRRIDQSSGTFFVKIYAAAEVGIPGQMVAGGNLASDQAISQLSTDDNAVVTYANLSLPLVTNSEYFVVVGLQSTNSQGLLWGYAAMFESNSVFNLSSDSGLTWGYPDYGYPQRLTVEGDFEMPVLTNHLPELALPTNSTLCVLANYVDSARAIDPDGDDVTFSLIAGPEGLTVSQAGLIEWTPAINQSQTTNLITICVTDSGSPALAVTNSFVLVVGEWIVGPQLVDTLTNGVGADYLFETNSGAIWAAQSFNSGPNNWLTRVELNLHRTNLSTGTFSVSVYEAASRGVPGHLVAGGSLVADQAISNLVESSSGTWKLDNLNIPLVINTEYFIVVQANGIGLRWGYSDQDQSNSAFNQSNDQGVSWSVPDYTYPQRMRIDASVNSGFSVLSRPVLSLTVNPDRTARLSWNSIQGQRYRVEYTDYIGTGVWYQMGGAITATGTVTSISQPMDQSYRCYRVEVLP